MPILPTSLKKLADLLTTLPSIGPRQALRLAFYFSNLDKETISAFVSSLQGFMQLSPCVACFLIQEHPAGLCAICSDPERDMRTIAIVEKETDLFSLERAKQFTGRYLIFGDLKKNGVFDPIQQMKIAHLQGMIKKMPGGIAEEIILALSPTAYGDLHASLLRKSLEGYAKRITRLGRGIPTGGEVEFADEETLRHALEHRN